MNVIRAFIAIDLSQEVIHKLDHFIAGLKEKLAGVPLQWVVTHNIHLTIKFLGDTPIEILEKITNILLVEASRHEQFEMKVAKLGVFPSNTRPRVVWVGIDAPDLYSLQKGIEGELALIGLPAENRKYSPHLTLARLSKRANSDDSRHLGEFLCHIKGESLGISQVHDIHLYRSELNPRGSIYTRLFSAPLKQ